VFARRTNEYCLGFAPRRALYLDLSERFAYAVLLINIGC